MKLSKEEQETIVNYNEAETLASIYTHNKKLQRQLSRLCAERPDEARLVRKSHDDMAHEYELPKSWLRIRPPRVASEAQRAAARQALARARESL